ncbi:MAG: putative tellurite resistance protein B-like protein [Lysobacterales bacterium]|jgi:uncharacterized tellurite resistance protein B-like protein
MEIFILIKDKVLGVFNREEDDQGEGCVDNLIALGVLFWVVAEADDDFLCKEKEKIEEIISEYGDISAEDMPIVLRSVEEASLMRIDVHSFTKEVKENLTDTCKIGIIENLFRVACVDKNISPNELEMIRTIAGLFNVEHKDFIEAKIKIKREFGMETVEG